MNSCIYIGMHACFSKKILLPQAMSSSITPYLSRLSQPIKARFSLNSSKTHSRLASPVGASTTTAGVAKWVASDKSSDNTPQVRFSFLQNKTAQEHPNNG
ncbi:MAG: hypothetical protein Q4A11_00745 [Brachymonas sp.]|nr:hypothetical protein [Brachymonas sp.]